MNPFSLLMSGLVLGPPYHKEPNHTGYKGRYIKSQRKLYADPAVPARTAFSTRQTRRARGRHNMKYLRQHQAAQGRLMHITSKQFDGYSNMAAATAIARMGCTLNSGNFTVDQLRHELAAI